MLARWQSCPGIPHPVAARAPGTSSWWRKENVKIDTIYTIKKIISCATAPDVFAFLSLQRLICPGSCARGKAFSEKCRWMVSAARKRGELQPSNMWQKKIIHHHGYRDEQSYRCDAKFCINIRRWRPPVDSFPSGCLPFSFGVLSLASIHPRPRKADNAENLLWPPWGQAARTGVAITLLFWRR